MSTTASFPAAVALPAAASARPAGWRSLPAPTGIARLTRIFALLRELVRLQGAWLAGVPYWDAKQRIAADLLADARLAEGVLRRLHELKAASAEHREVPGLDALVADLACAPHGDDWLRACYGQVKPWFAAQVEACLADCDPVMDAPTHDVLRRLPAAWAGQAAWFRGFVPAYSTWERPAVAPWADHVAAVLGAADLTGEELYPAARRPRRPEGHPDFAGVAVVRRDRTFRLSDRGIYPREGGTFAEKRFLVFYNHVQEMQFAESLGAILYETAAMPWAFHLDLARHLADEVRHAHMGATRLQQLGIPLTEVPMLTQHYEFRSHLDPLERFCLMTLVMEATAFERKRANVELFEQAGDEVSTLYESYDIRDEMLHTNLGHVWVPILLRVYHDARSVPELVEHCRGQIAQVITEYPANAANMIKR